MSSSYTMWFMMRRISVTPQTQRFLVIYTSPLTLEVDGHITGLLQGYVGGFAF